MMKNWRWIFVLALFGLVLLSGCGRKKEPDFAMYLLLSEATAEEALTAPLAELPLNEEALLTMEDVVSYQAGTHELILTSEAAGRISRMAVPLDGLPFVVVAHGERVYPGAFWTPISSLSYSGVAAMILPVEDAVVLQFELGYPASPELFEGVDLRNDERILDAFSAAGKLIEGH